jgi:hypothetical protein
MSMRYKRKFPIAVANVTAVMEGMRPPSQGFKLARCALHLHNKSCLSSSAWAARAAAISSVRSAFGFLRKLSASSLLTRAPGREMSAACAVMYIMIGCVGYYRLGSDFDKSKPVTSVLPQDIWTRLANVGLLAHCIIAYMVRLSNLAHDTGVRDAQQPARPACFGLLAAASTYLNAGKGVFVHACCGQQAGAGVLKGAWLAL